MRSGLKKANLELLKDFIREYQNHPCLWHVKSKDFHNKAKRDAAYNLFVEKCKLIDVNTDKDTVVKKINSFRTDYRREKKVEDADHSGMGTDERYEPTLWHLFHFIRDQETPRKSVSNLNETEEEIEAQPDENSQKNLDPLIHNDASATHDDTDSQTTEATPSTVEKSIISRPPKRKNDKGDTVLEAIESRFKKPKIGEDKYDIFGKNVALDMRDVTNNRQRLLAEKIIDDTLFMAEIGQLTPSHGIRGETNNTFTDCSPTQHFESNYSNFPSTFPQSHVHYETPFSSNHQ